MIGFILRAFSYLFHVLLSLFLIALATVTLAGGKHNLKLALLPWEGAELTYWVLGLGVCGIVCVLLALTGILRLAFPLWALAVLILMVRGFFLSPYSFSGRDSFGAAVLLTLCAFIAAVSSWTVLRKRYRPA